MPIKLSTTVQKIVSLQDKANSLLFTEFYEYMRANNVSESRQNSNLKVMIAFAKHLGPIPNRYHDKRISYKFFKFKA